MSVRIVQLTDLHLYQDRDGRLAGVPTWATFQAVLDRVEAQHGDFHHLILTGDLAQDEALETYRMLREALGDWLPRTRLIPGNHDDPAAIRRAFPELFGEAGPLTFALDAGRWRIIGLDSHVPGEVGGRIDRDQLEWLRAELAREAHAPTLLFVHHPPVPIHVSWLDQIGLGDARGLIELIERSPQVKIVCAGHVHQAFSRRIGGAAMYTTPSTCVQFAARAEKSFDPQAAGYRTFTLAADGYRTEVHRLADRTEGAAAGAT